MKTRNEKKSQNLSLKDAIKIEIPEILQPSENRDPLLIRVNEAMVFFYNTELHPDAAPISNVWELTQEKYRGRVGIKNPMSRVTKR